MTNKKIFYVWKTDLKPPSDKSMIHTVEVLRDFPKASEKLDRRWVAVTFVSHSEEK